MTSRPLVCSVFALALGFAPRAGAVDLPPLRPRGMLGVSLGSGEVTRSAYTDTASVWGYDGFTSKLVVAVDGGVFVTRWLLLGARIGYGRSSGGNAPNDQSALSLGAYDVGALVRVGVPIATPRVMWFFGAELQGGAMGAWISLREQTQSRVVPRLGVGLFGQVLLGRVGVGLRYVRRVSVWSDAGGPGVDLDLGGAEASVSFEVGL